MHIYIYITRFHLQTIFELELELGAQLSSWDEDEAEYQTNYSGPRSYVTAISEVLETPLETCDGHAKNDAGEARFDSE